MYRYTVTVEVETYPMRNDLTETRAQRRFRFMLNLALFVPVAFILIMWLLGAWQGFVGVDSLLHPARHVFCCGTPSDAGYAFDSVSIHTDDDLMLAGWYLPARRDAALILAHSAGANRGNLWELGRRLNDEGYGVLLPDLRAHGESEGNVFTRGWLDVTASAAFLDNIGVSHVGVIGVSLGANMSLQAAALSDDIEAVVADGVSPVVLSDFPMPTTLSGWLYLPYDVVYWSRLESVSAEDGGFAAMPNREAVRRIAPRPLLLIAAGAEPSAAETNVARYFEREAPGSTQVWIIPNVYHGGGFNSDPETYVSRVLTFFATTWHE